MFIDHLMLLIVETSLSAIAIGLLLLSLVLFVECVAALFSHPNTASTTLLPRPRIDILIPAHNEVSGISLTIEALLPQLTNQDRLIVIADNCDDQTAVVSRELGAIVLERQDSQLKGKGYALDFGLQFIAAQPPDIVVIVDADCIVHQGTIERIARQAITATQPVQASYLMQKPKNSGLNSLLSTLAITVKNLVRPAGLNRLGFPCLLTGSGMAFPWSVIHTASLASSNIVEDMQLSVDLAIAGSPPVFCQGAQVTGFLPQQQQAIKSQRTRWEHGHLQTLLTQLPRLLNASIRQKRFDLLVLALELSIPPLSLLVSIWLIAIVASLLTGLFWAFWMPTILLVIVGLLITCAIFSAWAKFCRTELPLFTFLAIPLYILWKIPLYLAFLVKPQTIWVRTERDINSPRR